jgi:hypothetical protein
MRLEKRYFFWMLVPSLQSRVYVPTKRLIWFFDDILFVLVICIDTGLSSSDLIILQSGNSLLLDAPYLHRL